MSEPCFVCGYDNPNGIEIHHIVPRRFGGTDHPENTVHLCASFHQAIEKIYDDSFYERLHIQSREDDIALLSSGEQIPEEESLDREIPEDWVDVVFEKTNGEVRRIHCGYCTTVFEPYQHAAIARHLQIHHHLDPWRTPDVYDKLG